MCLVVICGQKVRTIFLFLMDKKEKQSDNNNNNHIYRTPSHDLFYYQLFFFFYSLPSHVFRSSEKTMADHLTIAGVNRACADIHPTPRGLVISLLFYILSLSLARIKEEKEPPKKVGRVQTIYTVSSDFIRSFNLLLLLFWDENAPTKLRFFRIDINTHSSSSSGGRIFSPHIFLANFFFEVFDLSRQRPSWRPTNLLSRDAFNDSAKNLERFVITQHTSSIHFSELVKKNFKNIFFLF